MSLGIIKYYQVTMSFSLPSFVAKAGRLSALALLFSFQLTGTDPLAAQSRNDDARYLAGAVPVKNGQVEFDRTYTVKGKTRADLMADLQHYVDSALVNGPDQLPQARLTEVTPDSGIVAASIEEYMYFKRTNWQIHRVHFYYQLVFRVNDGSFTATMRRLHYRYDPEVTAGEFDDDRRAEQWITDEAALTKNGTKLARISGKFRRHTIDRVNEVFRGAALATGAVTKRVKLVEVEE